VDEALVTELESAIADAGALVVRVRKYRRGAGTDGARLLREALALGDLARRLHRRDALDANATGRLLAQARTIAGQLGALIAATRDAPEYRSAVAAHRAGDAVALGRLLPAVFAELDTVPSPPDLFAPLAALRRSRLRDAADIVAEVLAARANGLEP
jgi:hypothetical protein